MSQPPSAEAPAAAAPPPPAGPPSAAPGAAPGEASAVVGRKVASVELVLLALLLPHWFIQGLIEERDDRQEAVRAEIARAWGRPQTLAGPVILLPYRVPTWRDGTGGGPQHWRRGTLTLLPAELSARVELLPETRRRGLFETVVYAARVDLAGGFALPSTALPPDQPEAELLWREARVVAGTSDLRLLGGDAPPLAWDGRALPPGEEGLAETPGGLPCGLTPAQVLHWPLRLDGPPQAGQAIRFGLGLALRGSGGFHLAPLARRVGLGIAGAWPTPSFGGADLPVRGEVTGAGFTAEWAGGGTRQPLLRQGPPPASECAAAAIGVELLEAVPTHRMVSRAAKYGLLFLALGVATYALFELTARIRIHPVQYGLLGASLVLFPLLLLALGEPLGFGAAYAISMAGVAAQAIAYTAAVTGRAGLAGVLAGALGALFAFLYVVLSLEAYALLVGALALFAALSVVMAATRRVRWDGRGRG